MKNEYAVVEISKTNHMIVKKGVGDRLSSVATCRSGYQAQAVVRLLNQCPDNSIELVKEFHQVFGLDCPEKVSVAVHEPTVKQSLYTLIANLKDWAAFAHKEAERNNKNMPLVRAQLMIEELAEVLEAMVKEDRVEILHELADMRYVVDGTIICYGMQNIFNKAVKEVHRANMSKLDEHGKPIINEAGRVVKSKRFKKANVSELFNVD